MHDRGSLRQRKYPNEFRIAPPVWPDDLAARLLDAARLAAIPVPPPDPAPAPVPAAAPVKLDFLAEACTGLWRLRQRMLEPGTDRPRDEMRRAYRHLESTWDALAQGGVDIIDHTGTPFDIGLSLKVVAYQPTPDVTTERVLETIKPTIYFKRDRLQMGEVIVATPETPA